MRPPPDPYVEGDGVPREGATTSEMLAMAVHEVHRYRSHVAELDRWIAEAMTEMDRLRDE